MYTNNKYVLQKDKRVKLGIFKSVIFYITIIILLFISFFPFSRLEDVIWSFLIITLLIVFICILFIIEILEKQKRTIFFIFAFTCFLCIFCSLISEFIYGIVKTYISHINGKLSVHQTKAFLVIGILGIYSFIVGSLLLTLNISINSLLFGYFQNNLKFEIDSVSNRFAVDVLTYTIYIGALFGLIFYGLFYSEKNEVSFFTGVNVTNIALATVGLVTFFWAAKGVKSKSIELDMTRSREAGRLFSEGSGFLNAPHNDKKYIGLSYLNMIASQSEGPLQKEAIDLMADFILNANDITTANKPRIRAMEYLSDRLKTDFLDDDIDELIKLSSSELTESNANYRFSQLNVIYENFNFSNDKKYLRYKLLEENKIIKKKEGIWSRLIRKNNSKLTEDDSCKLIAYNNCNFENYSGQNGIEKIILIYANNCHFKNCKIGIVKGYSKKSETLLNGGQEGEFAPLNNKFEQCDFSDSDGWNILRPSNRMEGGNAETIAENAFINCFYYSGHEPKGFVKERDGALLAEITSKEQFEELIGSSLFMYYSPPDGKRQTSHKWLKAIK